MQAVEYAKIDTILLAKHKKQPVQPVAHRTGYLFWTCDIYLSTGRNTAISIAHWVLRLHWWLRLRKVTDATILVLRCDHLDWRTPLEQIERVSDEAGCFHVRATLEMYPWRLCDTDQMRSSCGTSGTSVMIFWRSCRMAWRQCGRKKAYTCRSVAVTIARQVLKMRPDNVCWMRLQHLPIRKTSLQYWNKKGEKQLL